MSGEAIVGNEGNPIGVTEAINAQRENLLKRELGT